jgi:hypothetical protein
VDFLLDEVKDKKLKSLVSKLLTFADRRLDLEQCFGHKFFADYSENVTREASRGLGRSNSNNSTFSTSNSDIPKKKRRSNDMSNSSQDVLNLIPSQSNWIVPLSPDITFVNGVSPAIYQMAPRKKSFYAPSTANNQASLDSIDRPMTSMDSSKEGRKKSNEKMVNHEEEEEGGGANGGGNGHGSFKREKNCTIL